MAAKVEYCGMSAQDYRVHIKHTDGSFEYIPYFCLPANDLTDVIAPSCYSCFDYTNGLADLVRPFPAALHTGSSLCLGHMPTHLSCFGSCDLQWAYPQATFYW